MTPYQILGLLPNATPEGIKAAYRTLSMKHHPDRTGGDDTEFKAIKAAYEILSDPERRAKYDATGETEAKPTMRQRAEAGLPELAEHIFNLPDLDLDFNDLKMLMNKQLVAQLQGEQNARVALEAQQKKLARVLRRFKRSRGENLIRARFEHRLVEVKRQIATNAEMQQLWNEMFEVLKDYDYSAFDFGGNDVGDEPEATQPATPQLEN